MLGILLAAAVAASPPPPAARPLTCPAIRQHKTADAGRIGPQKLGDLPDAERYHAVWKEAGGCPIDEVWQNGRWVDRWAGPARPGLRRADGDAR